jgi:hypothetical protein
VVGVISPQAQRAVSATAATTSPTSWAMTIRWDHRDAERSRGMATTKWNVNVL